MLHARSVMQTWELDLTTPKASHTDCQAFLLLLFLLVLKSDELIVVQCDSRVNNINESQHLLTSHALDALGHLHRVLCKLQKQTKLA